MYFVRRQPCSHILLPYPNLRECYLVHYPVFIGASQLEHYSDEIENSDA